MDNHHRMDKTDRHDDSDWLAIVRNRLANYDPQILAVGVSLVVVFVTLVIFIVVKRSSKARRGVLIMGQCESGKTALFVRLMGGVNKLTYTSIKENVGSYRTKSSKTLKVIDIPGHERLRSQFLSRYASLAQGIIFMIDSATFQKDIRDVAEYLYAILTDPTIRKIAPSILVVCNKQDADLAKSKSAVRGQMENELNTLRMTRSGSLQATDESGGTTFLGKKGKGFEFADVSPIQLDFAESCVVGTNVDASSIEGWLERLA